MSFNEKLQKLRKEKGMSQENLAETLGVSRQAISKWESGQSYPETDKLIALSSLFGVTLDSLMKEGEIEKAETKITENPQTRTVFLQVPWSYEYKSKRTLCGLPLVHINIGAGLKRAKGVVAIGNAATGIISIGLAAVGVVSVGLASVGLIGVGTFAAALLLAVGAISVGTFSIGAIALGIFTLGAISIGMFSLGAVSVASHLAIGSYARGHIAIGEIVHGAKTIEVENFNNIFREVSKEQVKTLLNSEFPNMWGWVKNFVSAGFVN